MNSELIYALPSISAIAIKILLLWYGRRTLRSVSTWTLGFLCGLLGVNLCELALFWLSDTGSSQSALSTLVIYYVFAVISSACFFAISMQLSGLLSRRASTCIVGLMIVGVISLLIPNAAISGAQSIGYSVTRIAGPFYWILQVLIPGFWLGGSAALTYTSIGSENWILRRRSLALLIGALPLVLSVLIVMALMQAGVPINATIVVSLAINVLLGVLIYTEFETGIFRFLSYIPKTQEHDLVVHAARSAYSLSSHGLAGAVASFERALIQDALKRCDGNKTGASKLLGVSRATLRRKLST